MIALLYVISGRFSNNALGIQKSLTAIVLQSIRLMKPATLGEGVENKKKKLEGKGEEDPLLV